MIIENSNHGQQLTDHRKYMEIVKEDKDPNIKRCKVEKTADQALVNIPNNHSNKCLYTRNRLWHFLHTRKHGAMALHDYQTGESSLLQWNNPCKTSRAVQANETTLIRQKKTLHGIYCGTIGSVWDQEMSQQNSAEHRRHVPSTVITTSNKHRVTSPGRSVP